MSNQSLSGQAACPTTKQLREWLDSVEESADNLSDHVTACARCARVLATISDDEGLKQFAAMPAGRVKQTYSSEPEFEQLQAALKTLEMLTGAPPNSISPQASPAVTTSSPPSHVATEPHTDLDPLDAPSVDWLNVQLPPERFTVERLIGAGGAGAVYLAFDHRLQREVAIKVLARNSLRDRQRFLREARILAELEHPNIVRVFDFGTLTTGQADGGVTGLQAERFYLVMEYVAGGPVSTLQVDRPIINENLANLDRGRAGATPLGFQRLSVLIASAADGLGAAHAHSLVHRDVKPGNLLLGADGTSIKVADFGLARFTGVDATQVTRTGDLLGTPAYMSPEQATTHDVTASSDIYSLGATLYQLLAGTPPFQGSTAAILRQIADTEPVPPRVFSPNVPLDLEIVCLKAMAKATSDRYSSMDEFAADLRRFAANEAIHARPISSLKKGYRFLKRNPSFASMLLVVATLLMVLSLGGITAAVVFARQNARLERSAASESLAKNAAQESLRDAIEAADQLLLSVTEDTELLPRAPGSEEVARKLLNKAQEYYRRLMAGPGAIEQISFDAARARAGLAQISLRLGDAEGVEKEAEAALELLDSLPEDAISTEERAEVRAQTLGVLGKSLATRGIFDRAMQVMSEAVTVCETELERTPNHERLQFLLADSLRGRAVPQNMAGELEAAKTSLTQAQLIFAKLLTIAPHDPKYLRLAAGCESTLAVTLVRSDGYEPAREHLLKANAILKRLERDGQLPIRLRNDFASNIVNLASVEFRLGNHERAQELFTQAEQEYQQLSQLEPGVVEHKYHEVVTTLNSGNVAIALGTIDAMLIKYQGLLPKIESLLATSPDSLEYLGTLGMIQGNSAVFLRMLGRSEEALKALEASTGTLDRYAELVERTPDSLHAVAINQYEIAKCQLSLNQTAAGLEAIAASKLTTTAVLAEHPDYLPSRMHQVDELMVQCDLLSAAMPIDRQAYLHSAEQAFATSTALIKEFMDLPEYAIAHGTILSTLGDARLSNGQFDAAETAAEEGINHLRKLATEWEAPDLQDESLRQALLYNYLVQAEVVAQRLKKLGNASETEVADDSATAALKVRLQELIARCNEFGAVDTDFDFLTESSE